jgi:hypothetical protein
MLGLTKYYQNKKWRSHAKTEFTPINSEDLETRKIPYDWTEGILCPVYNKGTKHNVIFTEGYPSSI